MAEHAHNTTPSTPVTRRVLALGAGAFSAVGLTAGAAVSVADVAPNPDAELIRVSAELVACSREMMALCRQGYHLVDCPEADRLYEAEVALVPVLHELEERLAEMPARTPDGIKAKAEALRHRLSADADELDEPTDPDNALAWSLLKDVLAVA